MSEIPWGNFEQNEDLPKLKQANSEDIQKVWEDIEYSNHLKKVNDVLWVLDFPDNIEEKFRTILDKQDDKTLIELSKQSKQEIQSFLLNNRRTEKFTEEEKHVDKSENINSKISKIKSTFTPEILSKNPDIENLINSFDLQKDEEENMNTIDKILNLLKEPWKLKSIVDTLWWADKNNPQYVEFKNNLIWIDSSFESHFNNLENQNSQNSLSTNEIIWEIENESWWLETIDLNSSSPVSTLSLKWSSYSFDKEIDKQALNELEHNHNNKLEEVENGFAVLKGVYTPLSSLLNKIWEHWWKEDFKENLKTSISNFPKDTLWNLNEVYENLEIDSSIQLQESDISSLADINSANELKSKVENIKNKLVELKKQLFEKRDTILKEYKNDVKELASRKKETKEKELEVLKFFNKSGYDLLPKNISNKLINELKSNIFRIPWLDLSVKNIDIKNWHFWESSAFIDKNSWINIEAKRNIVKFINKTISWNIKEPLGVDAIANWTAIANPTFLKTKCKEAWIIWNLGWNYNKIVENLKKEQKKL